MVKNEFGKVVFIAREKVKKGYLLREMSTGAGVVLEYYVPEGNGVDVVTEFKGAHINNDADFTRCLAEARKYVGDLKVPIQVDLNVRR